MSKQTRQQIEPDAIDVGISPDIPGNVVSIFQCPDGTSAVIPLPPEVALLYAVQLQRCAQELLSGSVKVSAREPSSGHVITVERSRPDRLDS